MLNKITDIKAGTGFEGSNGKAFYYPHFYKRGDSLKHNFNDSADLSPAMDYLNSVHWKLNELVNHNGLLSIKLIIDGYEVSTIIDLEKTNTLSYLNYKIIKTPYNEFTKYLEAELKYNVVERESHFELPFELATFKKVFHRFDMMEDIIEINHEDSDYFINEILEDIYPDLNYEFSVLTTILFNFLEKLTNSQIIISKESSYEDNMLVILRLFKNK